MLTTRTAHKIRDFREPNTVEEWTQISQATQEIQAIERKVEATRIIPLIDRLFDSYLEKLEERQPNNKEGTKKC